MRESFKFKFNKKQTNKHQYALKKLNLNEKHFCTSLSVSFKKIRPQRTLRNVGKISHFKQKKDETNFHNYLLKRKAYVKNKIYQNVTIINITQPKQIFLKYLKNFPQ